MRLKEPSTWAGFGVLLMSLNQIFDINEAQTVGEAVVQNAGALATGDYVTAGVGILGALAAMFLPEGKK